jgi:recombination protein RecR
MSKSAPPNSIYELIEDLRKLPGVGRKTAMRYAYWLVSQNQDYLSGLSDKVRSIKSIVKVCKVCGNKTESEVCNICLDKTRNQNQICLLEKAEDILPFEKTGIYQGVYHVLGGLIDPLKKTSLDELNFQSLISRLSANQETEVIIALNPTIQGETTTLTIKEALSEKSCKVSLLGRGISMGTTLEYIDSQTLQYALSNRK